MQEHMPFLTEVKNYIQKNPEVAAYINDYVARGIEESRQEALARAADMELALTIAMAKRFKNGENFILNKLEKWQGKSVINWSLTIAELKKRIQKANEGIKKQSKTIDKC